MRGMRHRSRPARRMDGANALRGGQRENGGDPMASGAATPGHPSRLRLTAIGALLVGAAVALPTSGAGLADEPLCGDEGVWIQVLGSGSGALDGRGAASYLVWLDNQARLLVDPGPGSAVRFGEARADFEDLDAIAISNVRADRTSDLPAFIGSGAERERRLPVLGPAGAGEHPSTTELVARLLGAEGAYAELAGFLVRNTQRRLAAAPPDAPGANAGAHAVAPPSAEASYHLDVENIPTAGNRRWARFGSPRLSLSAIAVHHGGEPSLAWRVEVGGKIVVFTGNLSNRKDVMWRFAKGADALVIHHAIPENARGAVRERHVTPSQIGRIAQRAGARMVLLGNRAPRTQGLESISRAALEAHYRGPLLFANELECWGL